MTQQDVGEVSVTQVRADELSRILELASETACSGWRVCTGVTHTGSLVCELGATTDGAPVIVETLGEGSGDALADAKYIAYMDPNRAKRLVAELERLRLRVAELEAVFHECP